MIGELAIPGFALCLRTPTLAAEVYGRHARPRGIGRRTGACAWIRMRAKCYVVAWR